MGLNKETFEELLRKAGIPCPYICRKSFATRDVLLPTEEQAAKAAANNIVTKHFRLQPEYKGTRRLRVTVSNVPAYITGEVLAAYLSAYGQVEEFNLLRFPAGTAYGDYAFRLCLTRDGFKAIPETLISGDRQMMVMVEGRRPRCWACKQIGHIAKFCPQKNENAAATTTSDSAATTTTTISKQAEAQGPSQVQPKTNDQEGWTEVTRKRKVSPKQGEKVQIHPLLRNKPRPQQQQQHHHHHQNHQQHRHQLHQKYQQHRHPKPQQRYQQHQQLQRHQQHQYHQHLQYHQHPKRWRKKPSKPNRRNGDHHQFEEEKGQWWRGR